MKTASAALAEAAAQLEKVVEKAPFPGTVLSWQVEPGQSVMPGQTPFCSAIRRRRSAWTWWRRISAGDKPGTQAEIISETGTVIRSRVSEVAPMAAEHPAPSS